MNLSSVETYQYSSSPSHQPAIPSEEEDQDLRFDAVEGATIKVNPSDRLDDSSIPLPSEEEPWVQTLNHDTVLETYHYENPAAPAGSRAGTQEVPIDAAAKLRDELHLQQRIITETQKAEERGRIAGHAMGRSLGRNEALTELEAERERLVSQSAALVASFHEESQLHLLRLEEQAATLALAVAAKILRRELQIDQFLLLNSVHAALRQLASAITVRLLVPTVDREGWQQALSRQATGLKVPQIVGDDAMQPGDCRIETELGHAELGIWYQLKSIEHSFFATPLASSEVL